MFYSQFILAKKGPLGTIWIAAHLERKLRKNQVADTDIGVSVDSILFPEMPIALRLSSHLLLGVVRIYSRKVNYLFDDCSEALLKVKQAFRSSAVDLPPEESTAPYHSITLPETFDLDDFELPDNDIFQGNYVDQHIGSRDQITLQDNMEGVVYSTSKFGLDERFGDGDASGLELDEELLVEKAISAGHAVDTFNSDIDPQASVQARAPLKFDGNQDALTVSEAILANGGVNQMEDIDGDNEPVEYAQAPCTPGLWEEPNLSNIQETSACDDHQEPENHNVTESALKEKLEIASRKVNEYVPHEQEGNQFEPQEKSAPIIATEPMSMDDLDSTHFTEPFVADQFRFKSPKSKVLETDGSEGVQDLLNPDAMHKGREVQSVDNSHERTVELQGNLENTWQVTTPLESSLEPLGKDNLHNPKDQALRQSEDPKISTLSGSLPCADSPVPRPCVTRVNHSDINDENEVDPAQLTDVASLRPLETSVREEPPSASGDSALVQGEGTNALDSNLQEIHVTEPGPHDEVHVTCNLSNEQADSVIQGDKINSYTFPAAERLLSVPERVSDVANHLLLEMTPAQEDMVRGDGGYCSSDMLTGKKRNFTESSLMTKSSSLVESHLFTTKRTAESVPDDDDLLSSILVGRSSVLKVKPTPPPEMPPKRQRQSAPRTGVSKRKVLMDDNMVLHGDTIRQQLTNTEDIRRLRKKAPCTWPEISMIQKQLWEDELFDEAIFSGMSSKLASLHSQSCDLSTIRVSKSEVSVEGATNLKFISQNDKDGTHLEVGNGKLEVSLEPNVPKENGHEANFYSLANEDVREAEPFQKPSMPDSQPCENNTTSSYYYGSQEQMHATGEVTESISSEHELLRQRSAMEIDGKTFSAVDAGNPVVPIEVESLACATGDVPRDTCDMSIAPGQVEKTSETDASRQIDAPGIQSDDKMDLLSIDMGSSMDVSTSKYAEANVGEVKVDIALAGERSETKHELVVAGAEDGTSIETLPGLTHCLESRQVANASTTFSLEPVGSRLHFVTLDEDMEEIKQNEEEFVNEDKALQPEVECNAKDMVPDGLCSGELAAVTAYNAEVNSGSEDVLLDNKVISGDQDAYPATNIEDVSANNRVDGDELEYSAVGNDTDFLNFDDDDDDDGAEAAGDYLPNTEAKRLIDDSGWSSRTKAVAKYLQIMFDKEGERGRMALPVNNLLAGKTRKEASRMFFETLVLKTKDYIHVEQQGPFENIDIFPRSKLLKSDF